MSFIVAIDGPAGAGKSTVARAVATRLGFAFVDTGAIYRSVALAALRSGVALDDAAALGRLAASLPLSFRPEGAVNRVFVDDDEVTLLEVRHCAFHDALIAACRSDWLLDFAQKLYVETERYRYLMLANRSGDRTRDISDEHEQLMAAALGRQSERACALLRGHLHRTAVFLEGLMQLHAIPSGPDRPARGFKTGSKKIDST